MGKRIEIYDTTLRDGAQAEEVSFSVEDKLRITEKLDELGIQYVEGGYPGANPRDAEYFREAAKLTLRNSTVVAFGSTHRPGHKVERDRTVKAILDSGTPAATIFGKTWDFHAEHALKRSTSTTGIREIPNTPLRASARPRRRVPSASCSATPTAAPFRRRSRRSPGQ
jgi:2-isopropylmalate synthase